MPKLYEDELQLLADKVEGIDNRSWEEMIDELHINVHPDSLRKSFSGGRYGGYQVYKYFQKKFENEYCAQEEIDRLEELKREVYKEKVKLSDTRREYRNHLRNEARFENLLDVLRDEVRVLGEVKLKRTEINANSGVSAALLISDLHYGTTVDNVFNYYDAEVAEDRLSQLLNKTIYYCGANRVQTLYINILGDMVAGNIHTSIRCEQEEDVISQIVNVSNLLVNFISELSKHVPEIKIVGVQGNHGRVTPNLKESLTSENYERLIFEFIRVRLPDVPMIINGLEDWATYNIGERKIFVEHGDKAKIDQVKNKAINLLGYVPDDIFVGHYHCMKAFDDNNTDIVVNGSILSTDSYAMKQRLNTRPHQILRVYDNDDVCTYKINLK